MKKNGTRSSPFWISVESEFSRCGSSREWDCIPYVLYSSCKLHEPFKSQSKTSMRNCQMGKQEKSSICFCLTAKLTVSREKNKHCIAQPNKSNTGEQTYNMLKVSHGPSPFLSFASQETRTHTPMHTIWHPYP